MITHGIVVETQNILIYMLTQSTKEKDPDHGMELVSIDVVFPGPVRSGYGVSSNPNWDRDRLA